MWKPLENPYSPVMPGAFSKIIIYIIIIKHLYSAINKCKPPVKVGKALALPQVLVGWQWLHGWPVVAEVRAGRTGPLVVLLSQCGVGAAEPAEATHKEPPRVVAEGQEDEFGADWRDQVEKRGIGLQKLTAANEFTFLLAVTATRKEVCTLRLLEANFFWGNLTDLVLASEIPLALPWNLFLPFRIYIFVFPVQPYCYFPFTVISFPSRSKPILQLYYLATILHTTFCPVMI